MSYLSIAYINPGSYLHRSRDIIVDDLAMRSILQIYGTPIDACISVSSLLCVHIYTALLLFATLVSRIITFALPYNHIVVRVRVLLYSVHSHLRMYNSISGSL